MAEFVIVFREVLEVSLIIGILYTYLAKSKNAHLINQLWQGVCYAIIASIIGAVLFQKYAGGFAGQAEKLFEGIVMITASIMLGIMIIWMSKNQDIALKLKQKANHSINNSKLSYGIFALAFISVILFMSNPKAIK